MTKVHFDSVDTDACVGKHVGQTCWNGRDISFWMMAWLP